MGYGDSDQITSWTGAITLTTDYNDEEDFKESKKLKSKNIT